MAGCKNCKKKPPVTELPPVVEEQVWVPTKDEIVLAYAELSNMKGVSHDKRAMINKVFNYLFDDTIDFDCGGCITNQGMRFHNYMKYTLKENV
jgi:hypothetical protein